MKVYLDRVVQIASLITIKARIIILVDYLDFKDIFSNKFAMLLPEHIEINTHAINLE